jgi:hypothetical protein
VAQRSATSLCVSIGPSHRALLIPLTSASISQRCAQSAVRSACGFACEMNVSITRVLFNKNYTNQCYIRESASCFNHPKLGWFRQLAAIVRRPWRAWWVVTVRVGRIQ